MFEVSMNDAEPMPPTGTFPNVRSSGFAIRPFALW
jgi:hypothetical protein